MPCNYIVKNSIELKAADFNLLEKAIKGMGGEIVPLYFNHDINRPANDAIGFKYEGATVTIWRNKITAPVGKEAIFDKVKVAYSREIVKAAAKRFGWTLKQTGKNKLNATRGF